MHYVYYGKKPWVCVSQSFIQDIWLKLTGLTILYRADKLDLVGCVDPVDIHITDVTHRILSRYENRVLVGPQKKWSWIIETSNIDLTNNVKEAWTKRQYLILN